MNFTTDICFFIFKGKRNWLIGIDPFCWSMFAVHISERGLHYYFTSQGIYTFSFLTAIPAQALIMSYPGYCLPLTSISSPNPS